MILSVLFTSTGLINKTSIQTLKQARTQNIKKKNTVFQSAFTIMFVACHNSISLLWHVYHSERMT